MTGWSSRCHDGVLEATPVGSIDPFCVSRYRDVRSPDVLVLDATVLQPTHAMSNAARSRLRED